MSGASFEGMTIAEMARESGLGIHTLRYYEKVGLIQPISRLPSGHRRYGKSTAQLLESLSYLRAAGLSIADMRTYVHSLDEGDAAAEKLAAMLRAHAETLRAEIERLQTRLSYIELKAQHWQARADGEAGSPEALQLAEQMREISRRLR